jgi:hypothetical protein
VELCEVAGTPLASDFEACFGRSIVTFRSISAVLALTWKERPSGCGACIDRIGEAFEIESV